MEPASALATVALAAATILPLAQVQKPTITIILKNWVNKNGYPINIYSIENDDYDLKSPTGQKPIAQIMPGQAYDINVPLDLAQDQHNNTLRFRAQRDDSRCCLDLRFYYCTNRAYTHLAVPNFTIFFHTRARLWHTGHQLNCFSETFDCRYEDAKRHLVFEIDGKILGCDMGHSRLSVQKIVKTKIA